MKTLAEFKREAFIIHNGKYLYDNIKSFIRLSDKQEFYCEEHGSFEQSLQHHLKGQGCSACGSARSIASRYWKIEELKAMFTLIHSNKYSYEQFTKYGGIYNKVPITCQKHGIFYQASNEHLKGKGCKECGIETANIKRADSLKEPHLLYVLKIPKLNIYKVGVTLERVGVQYRYHSESIVYEEIQITRFSTGVEAYQAEEQIKYRNRNNRYNGPRVFKYTKNTEIFRCLEGVG